MRGACLIAGGAGDDDLLEIDGRRLQREIDGRRLPVCRRHGPRPGAESDAPRRDDVRPVWHTRDPVRPVGSGDGAELRALDSDGHRLERAAGWRIGHLPGDRAVARLLGAECRSEQTASRE